MRPKNRLLPVTEREREVEDKEAVIAVVKLSESLTAQSKNPNPKILLEKRVVRQTETKTAPRG